MSAKWWSVVAFGSPLQQSILRECLSKSLVKILLPQKIILRHRTLQTTYKKRG